MNFCTEPHLHVVPKRFCKVLFCDIYHINYGFNFTLFITSYVYFHQGVVVTTGRNSRIIS